MSHTLSPCALGFLTVQSSEEAGLIGGYLVLNSAGRPLEFHCTVPVKPNRAQQILFGPTLEPFLYGEQIGQALVNKSSLAPVAICTNVAPALAVRDFIEVPVALVLGAALEGSAAPPADPGTRLPTGCTRVDGAEAYPSLAMFALGQNRLAVSDSRRRDQDEIQQRLATHAEFDLAEPFERIREAIVEAHKQGRS